MIKLNNIYKYYKNSPNPALQNISLEVEKGDILGIIGFSGAGKSTLLRTINHLEPPGKGQVIIDNINLEALNQKDLLKVRRNIGMIFQSFNLLKSKSIKKNISLPLEIAKTPKKIINQKVQNVLELVGLSGYEKKYPQHLSGGQKQRVGIARSLVLNPKVLLCDEPTSALDTSTTFSILNLLKKINKDLGITIIIITHDINVVKYICNKVAIINEGKIVENGKTQDVFDNPKSSIAQLLINHSFNTYLNN